jgi:hypothetical protein
MLDKSLPTTWMLKNNWKLGDVKNMAADVKSLTYGEPVTLMKITKTKVMVESVLSGHVEWVGIDYISD